MTPIAASRRARALMERVLCDGGSLADEYPLLFGAEPAGHMLALEESEQVRSACAVLVRDFIVSGTSVRVGMVGSVVTDPAWRGRGLATRLLSLAEDELAKDGCVLALLWAEDPSFYEARGWHAMGTELDFVITPEERTSLPAPRDVRAMAPDDFGAVHRLYTLHRERVERAPRETAALLGCAEMETLVIQRAKDIVAYSCMGRGRDLGRTVHEWAGSTDDILALVRAHLERSAARGMEGPVYLMTPPSAGELHTRLEDCGAVWSRGVLGHGKLLDAAAGADLVARIAGPDARTEVDCEGGEPRISIHGPGGGRTLGGGELLDLLAPAYGESEALQALREETGLALEGLPLGLWAWGLDSI